MRDALASLGVDLDVVAALEPDAALGNGGLGRLAACFMESMATVDIPAYGYGIRYVHGLFRQQMQDGWQVELPETWLAHGNPWEFERRESSYEVGFGGSVETIGEAADGTGRCIWRPQERVIATAYDTPVVGWRARRVNTLRLWTAQPIDPILLDAFNAGDHIGALRESNKAETLARVLYPADATPAGQELRLRQEFFFSSASLQDILRRHIQQYNELRNLAGQGGDPAQRYPSRGRRRRDGPSPVRRPSPHLRAVLGHRPRSASAIPTTRCCPRRWKAGRCRSSSDCCRATCRSSTPSTPWCCARPAASTSTIPRSATSRSSRRTATRRVRMGNLAFVGSHSINGVSALHTELMKETVFANLHRLYPDRINNKTNGITPRRWLMQCNPDLFGLLRATIGDAFMDDTQKLVRARSIRGRSGLRRTFRRRQAAEQGAPVEPRRPAHGRPARSGRHVRRPHQAHPRVQAPAAQHHRGDRPLRPDPLPSGARLGAPRQALRRQGRAELLQRQADHQADQRRRPRHQQRPRRARSSEDRLHPELQRLAGRGHGAGGRSLRADFDRRHGSVRNRQHEVRVERSIDDRHARRGECRDPGARRARTTS